MKGDKFYEDFIPYGKQNINEEDIEQVVSVLKSKFITQGPMVPSFEEQICRKVNSKYAIATNSATSCLHIACLALDLGINDILWTSPITFVASANCALYCGAKVDFVDVNYDTGLMSVKALEKKLIKAEKEGFLPKIVIPVHLAGSSCDMKRIYELSQRYGFSIIEDASHAIGGKYFDGPVGSCRYSDIAIFSFHPVKIITTGEGGVCTTNSESLTIAMRELRSHGITKDKSKFLERNDNQKWKYEQQRLGFNYRLTDIAASLGISQLKRLENIVLERNQIFQNYKNMILDERFNLNKIPEGIYSSLHLAILRFENYEYQEILFENFSKYGVGTQVHYMPVHLQPFYKSLGFKEKDFPNAENFSKSILSIPLYPGLSKIDQKKICQILNLIKK